MKKQKRYVVSVWTKRFIHMIQCNSLKKATFIMNLKCWKYAKITDTETYSCINCKPFKKKS